MEQCKDFVKELLPYELREEQWDIITKLLQKKNVMGVLPTGYGKSECYALIPVMLDHLHPEKEQHIAVIISPLRSLMFDQVNRWTKVGISCAAITRLAEMDAAVVQGILKGTYSLLFSSPEAILLDTWWDMVKSLRKRICLLALDEVHCLIRWGESFRQDYRKVSSLRSLIPNTPVLAVTATVTQSMVDEIWKVLHLSTANTKLVGIIPDRPNISLSMTKVADSDFTSHVGWYIKQLKNLGGEAPRAIIYARTIDMVTSVYGALMFTLGDYAWADGDRRVRKRLVEMFHSHTDEESQKRILSAFPRATSPLRCVVATVAFGMGVQVPDVRFVIHWGPCKDTMGYWQEIGRCCRDGEPGEAFMYLFPKSVNKRYIHTDMLQLIEDTIEEKGCIRQNVLHLLKVKGMKKVMSDNIENCCIVCNSDKSG